MGAGGMGAGDPMPARPAGPPGPRALGTPHEDCLAKLDTLTKERPGFGLPRVDYVAQYSAKCPTDPTPPKPGAHPAEPLASAPSAEPPARPKPVIDFPWPA